MKMVEIRSSDDRIYMGYGNFLEKFLQRILDVASPARRPIHGLSQPEGRKGKVIFVLDLPEFLREASQIQAHLAIDALGPIAELETVRILAENGQEDKFLGLRLNGRRFVRDLQPMIH